MAEWSEEAFEARVRARARELGTPLAQCLEEAGLGHDTLLRNPKSRRLDTLLRLAGALRWSLAEIMGFADPDRNLSLELMSHTVAIVDGVLKELPTDAPVNRARLFKLVYDGLLRRQREGRAFDEEVIRDWQTLLVKSWEDNLAR